MSLEWNIRKASWRSLQASGLALKRGRLPWVPISSPPGPFPPSPRAQTVNSAPGAQGLGQAGVLLQGCGEGRNWAGGQPGPSSVPWPSRWTSHPHLHRQEIGPA